jgi:hypothetical protein
MKKLIIIIVFIFIFIFVSIITALLFPNTLLAGRRSEIKVNQIGIGKLNFKLLNGFEKDIEYTFNSSRTISGTSEEDTIITVTVFRDKEMTQEVVKYVKIVSSLGIFSQEIDLRHGGNYILINAAKGTKEAEVRVSVTRLDIRLKQELENYQLPEAKIDIQKLFQS